MKKSLSPWVVLISGAMSISVWTPAVVMTAALPSAGCGGCTQEEWPTSVTPSLTCVSVSALTYPCMDPQLIIANDCETDVVLAPAGTVLAQPMTIPAQTSGTVTVAVVAATGDAVTSTYALSRDAEQFTLDVAWPTR